MVSLRDLFNGDVGDLQRSGIKFGHGLNHPDIFAYLKSFLSKLFGAYRAHSRGKWVAFVFGLKQKGGHKDRVWD